MTTNWQKGVDPKYLVYDWLDSTPWTAAVFNGSTINQSQKTLLTRIEWFLNLLMHRIWTDGIDIVASIGKATITRMVKK